MAVLLGVAFLAVQTASAQSNQSESIGVILMFLARRKRMTVNPMLEIRISQMFPRPAAEFGGIMFGGCKGYQFFMILLTIILEVIID